ncbi:hypothetical protein VTL71DRAFT_8504 [Oculimacula yallundae]|uniref:Uncharacterized protein n=1 Tax=Oculimacula yallundae TaxID=86028 RepID=A0ABR4CXS9_9HELO
MSTYQFQSICQLRCRVNGLLLVAWRACARCEMVSTDRRLLVPVLPASHKFHDSSEQKPHRPMNLGIKSI